MAAFHTVRLGYKPQGFTQDIYIWCAVPVLTLNVLFVSPAPAQQVPTPAPLIAAPESQPASVDAEGTNTAAPAPAKTRRTTAQSKKQEKSTNQATIPPSSAPLLAEDILKPAFFET